MNDKLKEVIDQINDSTFKVEVEVLDGGNLPSKAHKTDAGFDLYATKDMRIPAGSIIKHPLNIKLKLPSGTYAEITSKSGLGSKGLLVYAGIIDEGYRGIPHVVATNVLRYNFDGTINADHIEIKKGDKLAQLIIHPYSPLYFMKQVDKVDTATDRSGAGFGSTGR